jgi:hypothetical protein
MERFDIIFPLGYEKEKEYVARLIFQDFFGFGVNVIFKSNITGVKIIFDKTTHYTFPDYFFANINEDWLKPSSIPQSPPQILDLSQHNNFSAFKNQLPVIFHSNDLLSKYTFNLDFFGNVFYLITGYEEVSRSRYDSIGRFDFRYSYLVKYGLNERALVNEYIHLLVQILTQSNPGLFFKDNNYKLNITHDVDIPLSTNNIKLSSAIKNLLADIYFRQSPILTLKRLLSLFLSRFSFYHFDPNNNYKFLMEVSNKYNLKNSFYFIPVHRNSKYDSFSGDITDTPIIEILKQIHEMGHLIGIHPGFDSYENEKLLTEDIQIFKLALKKAGINQDKFGGRHHYLRWKNPISWRIWNRFKISYDSSVGFFGQGLVGFRYGTCYSFHPFDLEKRERLNFLIEKPLVVMDCNLFYNHFKGNYSTDSINKIKNLNSICKFFGGEFTILFHNNSIISRNQKKVYKDLINDLVLSHKFLSKF